MNVDYSKFELIQVEVQDHVLILTLNDPEHANAMSWRHVAELKELFGMLYEDNHIRAVLWRAEGNDFSTVLPGAPIHRSLEDPHPLKSLELTGAGIHHHTAYHMGILKALLNVPQPVVVAAQGRCTGMAANLVLCCDIIFGAEDLVLNDQHVKKAMVTGDGGAVIWPMILGPARAKQYLLTGDSVTAREAERMGMINQVVPREDLDQTALAFARRLAEGATMAIRFTKHIINRMLEQNLAYSWEFSDALQTLTTFTDDFKEYRTSVREKRPPQFTGR